MCGKNRGEKIRLWFVDGRSLSEDLARVNQTVSFGYRIQEYVLEKI